MAEIQVKAELPSHYARAIAPRYPDDLQRAWRAEGLVAGDLCADFVVELLLAH